MSRRTVLGGTLAVGAAAVGSEWGRARRLHATAATPRATPGRRRLRAVADGQREADYIVIGSGAGGGVVAANLAAAGYTVLVLEAGGLVDDEIYRVPAFHLLASSDPRMSWDFYVRHYTDTARHGRRYVASKHGMLYPRASTVGGCTAHHAMLAMRPDPRDWADLARLTGDDGYSSWSMDHYYRKVRRWLPIEQADPALLTADPVVARLVGAAALRTGTLTRGVDVDLRRFAISGLTLDPNDRSHVEASAEGLFAIPQCTRDGQRRGTRERLYELLDVPDPKLTIQIEALVHRAVIESDPSGAARATGVEVTLGADQYRASPTARAASGERVRLRARREVIVAGGTFNSPQLLQLSGIGDPAHLRSAGVTPLVDLPAVGTNLQDRYEVSVVTEFSRRFDLAGDCTFGEPGDPCLDPRRRGPDVYSSNGIVAGIKHRSAGSDRPDVFVFGSPIRFEGYEPGFARTALADRRYFTWAVLKGYTANASGTVRIRSADPTEPPEINFRYFDDGAGGRSDVDAVIEGIELARVIGSGARRLGVLDGSSDREIFPGRGDLDGFVRSEAWGHHASCSNPMGPADDPRAVVDPRFRVRGVRGLRVVDASVFPKIPGLYIVLPLHILAEKASDVILADAVRESR